MLIAIPTAQGVLCPHFGHCETFAMVEANDGKITDIRWLTPPPHEPGVIPRWLAGEGADTIIAGGMGARAIDLFTEFGIRVVVGAPTLPPEAIVTQFLADTLMTGANACDH